MQPFTPSAYFDFDLLREVAAVAVRMLDVALDATDWPLPRQAEGFASFTGILSCCGAIFPHENPSLVVTCRYKK